MDDKIITVSEAVRRVKIEKSNVSPEKVITIHNGIDTSLFTSHSNTSKQQFRKSLGIPDNVLLLGSVGRLHPSKGFSDLISALVKIKSKLKSVKVIIVGDGKLSNNLKLQVKYDKLSDAIEFIGLRNDVPDILSALDIFVLPSLWEAFGIAILEAMAAGKPVVATSVGGIPEVVIDGETGILVPASDPDALANAIIRLIEDEELRVKMGNAGRKRVLKHFTIQKMVNKTEQLYQELMIEKGLL
jgi:glycosyltransferase involved in cell wall biosynthesis